MLLTSIPSPEISYLEIGPVRINMYALCIMTGILAAALFGAARLHKRGGERGAVIDFVVWSVVLGIIGARLYHVLTHWGDFFGANATQNWWEIWNGGIAIFGALLGGALGVFCASRLTGVRFWSFADVLAPGLLLAQAFGRLGNWFNQELFGAPTTLPWGLEIDPGNVAAPLGLPPYTLYHPTFLYEIIWNLLGVLVLLTLEKKLRPRWGKMFALYLIWYGIGRFWLEGLRVDPSFVIWGLRTNELVALLAVILGIVLWIVQSKRHPGKEVSVYLPGRSRPGKSVLQATADPEKFYHVLLHPEAESHTAEPGTAGAAPAELSAEAGELTAAVASLDNAAAKVSATDTDLQTENTKN